MKSLFALSAAAAASAVGAAKNHWAVLVSGSNGYGNYRHHADVCHAYQILKENGVPEGNIITMLYDDVAGDPENPYPGKLFNYPTDTGDKGRDVYKGCKKSYTGEDVTAANLLAIITGNASAVQGGSGEVLQSGPHDHVFINFVDHGGPGMVAMPAGPFLYAPDLLAALDTMHEAKMYDRLVFYMEACESGSMFTNLSTDVDIYATTAANPDESSWGCFCPPEDTVDGVSLGTCLGDLYSVNWMNDTEVPGHLKEDLQTQYETVAAATNLSHVMQYGDLSWAPKEPVGAFVGTMKGGSAHDSLPLRAIQGLLRAKRAAPVRAASPAPPSAVHVSARHATIASLRARAASGSIPAALALVTELTAKERFDRAFNALAAAWLAQPSAEAALAASSAAGLAVTNWACYKAANGAMAGTACGAYTDYGLRYTRLVAEMCEAAPHTTAGTEAVLRAVADACAAA